MAKMNKGQRITIGGFVTAIVGVLLYCLANFFSGQLHSQGPSSLEVFAFMAIGLGVLAWLVGQFIHMSSVIDREWEK